jgi:hypothetical protein
MACAAAVIGGALLSVPHAVGETVPAAAFPAVPVASCKTGFGAQEPSPPPIPATLPVALSKRTAARLSFYSNGFVTVLAPRGWACAGVEAADGSRSLSVFTRGRADPLATEHPASDTAGVTALIDYTGHGPGAQLVCSLFPHTRAASLVRDIGGCPPPPRREQLERPTPDVVIFRDPPGLKGTGLPSGTRNAASGVVIFPQLNPEPASVPVAKETCSLPSATSSLCSAIVADFLTRARPGTTGGAGP